MKKYGHTYRNILLLNRDHHGDLIENAPMLEDATETVGIYRHDMPEEAFPELIDGRKTILVPMVQTMKDYILLHYKRGIASEVCRQIMDGEVATGYDIDDIQVIPQANTCRLRKMTFWRKSSSVIIADIDVGIDLFLKDGVIDDTVKASFRVTLHIDMDVGEILECNIYGESDIMPERDMWLLSDYLVPILRKDEIEAGAEELLERYNPEALCDLKARNAIDLAERMGLRVMMLPLHKRPKTKSILYFCASEIAVCNIQDDQLQELPEIVRIPGNTIVINTNVIPEDYCQLNIYHECIQHHGKPAVLGQG